MNVPQVACGAYHTVALVRSLPAKNYSTLGAPDRRERGRSPHFFVGEKEELSAVDGGHYCPLGVELTEGASGGEVNMNCFSHRWIGRNFCQPISVFIVFFLSLFVASVCFAVPDISKEKRSKAKAASWREVGGQQSWLCSTVTSSY